MVFCLFWTGFLQATLKTFELLGWVKTNPKSLKGYTVKIKFEIDKKWSSSNLISQTRNFKNQVQINRGTVKKHNQKVSILTLALGSIYWVCTVVLLHVINEEMSRSSFALLHIWQYRLWNFQTRGTKLERCLPKNQHTQKKLLNFENWINRGLRSLKSQLFSSSQKKILQIEIMAWF